MTEGEYQNTVKSVATLAVAITQFDLPAIIEAMNGAEAFGCFLDPTLWMKNIEKMREDRKIIEAAMPLWKLGNALVDRSDG